RSAYERSWRAEKSGWSAENPRRTVKLRRWNAYESELDCEKVPLESGKAASECGRTRLESEKGPLERGKVALECETTALECGRARWSVCAAGDLGNALAQEPG